MPSSERNRALSFSRRESGRVEQSVESLVRAELQKSPYPEVRALSCGLCDGVLTLRGIVSSYYLKQLAQRAVVAVTGDTVIIENKLKVGS